MKNGFAGRSRLFGPCFDRPEVRGRLFGQPVASDGARTELFYHIEDGNRGFEMFRSLDLEELGRHCSNEAVSMLSAKKCPSGEQICITDPSVSGLLAHEVMGHASEADEIIKNRSFLFLWLAQVATQPPGVRVERIAGLSGNLAMSLKAHAVRVQAPIPGKGLVGIEVPNSSATKVYLREILESKTWQAMRAAIPLVL